MDVKGMSYVCWEKQTLAEGKLPLFLIHRLQFGKKVSSASQASISSYSLIVGLF